MHGIHLLSILSISILISVSHPFTFLHRYLTENAFVLIIAGDFTSPFDISYFVEIKGDINGIISGEIFFVTIILFLFISF